MIYAVKAALVVLFLILVAIDLYLLGRDDKWW